MLGFVIGDSDMVTGFRLVGVEGTVVSSADEVQKALEKALERSDLGIVVVSEEFLTQPQIQEAIERIRHERVSPLIVTLPGSRGKPSGIRMSDLISKTLGIRM